MDTLEFVPATLLFLSKVLLIMITADFISGIVHWWEDTYGNPEWKFLGIGKYLIAPNLIHHQKPRDFIKNSYWKRNSAAIILSFFLSLISYEFVGIKPETALILFLYGSQAVQIHAIAHRTEKENGKFLTFLEESGLIQSKRHHARHHTAPHKCGYCLMTNWVNPILDAIQFWVMLEWITLKIFGIPVRYDHGRA